MALIPGAQILSILIRMITVPAPMTNHINVNERANHGPGRIGLPQHEKMGSDGSLHGSSFAIGLQSPPSLSYHNELATLNINDFKSA